MRAARGLESEQVQPLPFIIPPGCCCLYSHFMLKFFDLQIHFMAESKGGQRLHERLAVPLELLAAPSAVCGCGQVSCCGVLRAVAEHTKHVTSTVQIRKYVSSS